MSNSSHVFNLIIPSSGCPHPFSLLRLFPVSFSWWQILDPACLFLENSFPIESLLYSLARTSVAVLSFLTAFLVLSRKVHILRDDTKKIWFGRTEFYKRFIIWFSPELNKCKCTFSWSETSPKKVSPVLFCPVFVYPWFPNQPHACNSMPWINHYVPVTNG